MAAKARDTRTSNALLQQNTLHKQAYSFINSAIDFEQNGDKKMALEWYQKGKDTTTKALNIPFDPADKAEAEVLAQKMRVNLKLVNERMAILKGLKKASTSPPTSTSSLASSNQQNSGSSTTNNRQSKANNGRIRANTTTGSNVKVKPTPGMDSKLADTLLNEIVTDSLGISFDDIAGLENAKRTLQEIVITPLERPELFTGLRSPAKGVLLYGPPGTGKTLLAKAVASESKAKFFNLSASSLTSKWVGESEKLVKTLFQLAKQLQPSVIFIDEIDSILSERSSSEHEASRRLKTEFLINFDGLSGSSDDKIFVLAATNRPQELDEAARRRFVKRLYIPLPEPETREALIKHLLANQPHRLTRTEMKELIKLTDGHSGSDLTALTKDAALGPLRELGDKIRTVDESSIRVIEFRDFKDSMKTIRASVNRQMLEGYDTWSREFGSAG